jgi:cytochrome c oxidase subunit 2
MYPQFVIEAVYFLVVSIVVVFLVVFYVLTRKGRHVGGPERAVHEEPGGMGKGEKRWLYFLFAVAVVGNLLFLSPALPSIRYTLYEREAVMTVVIEVRDYRFYLPEKPIRIPVNVPVEFVVVSDDLVYGFGVFRKDGTMVFQMQVVPKPYLNRIVWVFDQPGLYDIRSTEYSGPKHPWMFVSDAIEVVGEGE